MSYAAKVLADSISPGSIYWPDGVRLTTMEVQFPRFILAEFNTHRKLSRNSASSRAIPVPRRVQQVVDNPFVPESFGKNTRGMQALAGLEGATQEELRAAWLRARDACVAEARLFEDLEAHKQHANRLIELWAWHTVVVTSSDWRNFLALRDHHAAQPEMQITARLMREAYEASTPRPLDTGAWHLPYVSDEDRAIYAEGGDSEDLKTVSVVRCAAVSFERQNAERTPMQIQTRHDDMVAQAHWSPFEHQAKVALPSEMRRHALFRYEEARRAGGGDYVPVSIGNLDAPWLQYRKTFPGEAVFVP